jgi:hypothetical protein
MAVEIRELVIKATVVKDDEYIPVNSRSGDDKAQIIQECVKEVLRVIAKSKNR